MKVLFAVSNENISESIIKKYQQQYKEIISSKNVYYFNAIVKELQKDKSYDRIIISEDLEPFANNNYEVIDKFIFEKLDSISDEATSSDGQDIPIILICADRREKSDPFLSKIFGIGVYSALLGQDRSVSNVCDLINKPRSKKDAKIYYRIDSEKSGYVSEGESDVSEVEIQNILNHYKKLGKNEEQYVVSFDNIATQYTDAQLRVICKFLPINVKAVLEASSPKYQELITFGTDTPIVSEKPNKNKKEKYVPNSDYQKQKLKNKFEETKVNKIDILEKNIGKSNLTKSVIIPSSRDISEVQKVNIPQQEIVSDKKEEKIDDIDKAFADVISNLQNKVNEENNSDTDEAPKKRRGRPKKVQPQEEISQSLDDKIDEAPKKKRGRPKKIQQTEENVVTSEETTVLPGFDDVKEEKIENGQGDGVNLFNLGDEAEEKEKTGGIILPGFDEDDNTSEMDDAVNPQNSEDVENVNHSDEYTPFVENSESREIESIKKPEDINIEGLLSRDKKMVAFVGTSKNGTSFLVNNLAEMMSKKGINTAILDLTKNKNAYYIYTENEESIRKKAYSCIKNLRDGIADGIQVNKNLTVYTTLPDEDYDFDDYQNILSTLAKNYSLILMDCDFETNYGYFKNAQEIYLVQSFDILTIQPLTAFLRDLKSKNVLNPEKLRIVLNKALRVRSVTDRTIIGGMAFYNDPAMSFMTELFNKDTVKYCSIPFEEQTYSRYLEGLVNCQITTNGYSKNFMMSLDKLSNMVYPLLANNSRGAGKINTAYNSNGFSNNINATLNKMKNNY